MLAPLGCGRTQNNIHSDDPFYFGWESCRSEQYGTGKRMSLHTGQKDLHDMQNYRSGRVHNITMLASSRRRASSRRKPSKVFCAKAAVIHSHHSLLIINRVQHRISSNLSHTLSSDSSDGTSDCVEMSGLALCTQTLSHQTGRFEECW